ncbi:MAG: protein kinase [Candidatus Aminicenantes bacterium]|nr:protein kinase [Candidatus Aminicenantes bacterium]
MTAKCPKCDFENPDDTRFCGNCASPLRPSKKPPPSRTETFEAPLTELTRGSTLADRYEVIEDLGRGGMARVYKAFDKEVEEKVALKLLKPEIVADEKTIKRFRNELKFARRIAHKNVCRMYDLSKEGGTYFITMEYVPGEDLKTSIKRMGLLSSGKALFIAKQVCEGLAEAHRLGIVHRDLKPKNIMIDRNGNARIMDFGIARSIKAKGLTEEGMMIGTPDYMSPEQAEGREIDHCSDIYSLGVILYEMVTGTIPFEGDTPISIAIKHKTDKPRDPREINPQISSDLSSLILKCMEKKKEDRYQNVEEILSELIKIEKGISTTKKVLPKKIPEEEKMAEMKRKRSIAVLPFADLSPKKDQEYFCDGMTDAIIGKLSQLEKLKVISRTSVMRYKKEDKDIKEIGEELDVATILEGTIQKEKDRIRIRAQLINVEDGFHLWAEIYDRKLESVFDMQDEISQAIVGKMEIKLVGEEKALLVKRYTENVEVYGLYMKGRHFWSKRTEAGLKKSIEYFEQAIEADPNYALAYAGLADAYNMVAGYIIVSPKEAFSKAKAAAKRALKIDDTLAEAHASLALIMQVNDYDWSGSEREFKRAIELNPNYAIAHQWYGCLLRDLGRFDEGLVEIQRAKELDPLSLPINTDLGTFFYQEGKYNQAIEQCQKAIEIDATFHWAHANLGAAYLQKSLFKEAIAEFKKAKSLSGGSSAYNAWLSLAYAMESNRKEAFKILEKLIKPSKERIVPMFQIVLVYTSLKDNDKAFEWLEKAYEERSFDLTSIKTEPVLDSLRPDPRFTAMLKKMGLNK